MDPPEDIGTTDKSWDHPWTTEEMRKHRDDWSLAADAGLLRHLQQFSDNLTERFEKTQEKLNSLSSELEEASVIIDNVTNVSLALANTQFIESRVYEDDAEMNQSQKIEEAKSNNGEQLPTDLIACVSESIKQGLSIMDEKFQRLEVLPSDSEDEGEIPIPSIVLKPNDPYENRPLPYVIGSDKWKASRKVGLESSSSDSEPPEGEEESSSENEDELRRNPAMPNNRRESSLRRSLSSTSSSELSGRNERGNFSKDYNSVSSRTDKLEARSQDTLNSGSEIATPSIVQSRAENSMKAAPSFAEELAKRLGNVLPSNRTVKDNQDADQSSINRFKDDLFASDGNDVFDAKSDNLFSEGNNLFEDEVSSSLWKNKPYRPPLNNIIPASLDVPPPMSAEATKPKSAFDDLCGDPDSDDSDNIFAPKSSTKSSSKNTRLSSYDKHENSEGKDSKALNPAQGEKNANIATSTPQINDNGGLFGDENDYDNDDLFNTSVRSRNRLPERTPELPGLANRTAPPGFPITKADILSSSIGNRLFQRAPRQESSDSSDTESSMQISNPRGNEQLVQESDSSGISIRPNNNTMNNNLSLGVDFQPQSESTRLKSEEIYRERFPSDSLFEDRTRQRESTVSGETSNVHDRARIISETLDSARDDDFDVDDVFEPPPLPKHNDSKSKSNDDLFSNSSSESRSHKSFDLLGTSETQYDAKITSGRSGGLFDEDIDIFGDGDVPQIDIFGEAFKSNSIRSQKPSQITRPDLDAPARNKLDLFSASVGETSKLTSDSQKPVEKVRSIFDDSEEEDDDDLFGNNFLKNDRKASKIMLEGEDDEIFGNKSSAVGTNPVNETKKESSSPLARDNVASESATEREVAKSTSDELNTPKRLPSLSSSGLFDNLDEKDDDDGLFSRGITGKKVTSRGAEKKLSDDNESRDEEILSKTNGTKIEESSKERVSLSDENKSDHANNSESPKNEVSLEKNDSSEKLFKDEKEVSSIDGAIFSKAPEVTSDPARRDPPKSLSIRMPVSGDDSSQAPPRRAISSKIQNLMGKMGNVPMPVWRKSEEKADSEFERTESKDSDDGAFMSVPDLKSPILGSKLEDDEISSESMKEPLPSSPLDDSGNSESAVSFDVPAQVEVLAVGASKSRARIQAKRRPQSRHARQTALRKSGIDFDTIDNPGNEAVESDPSDNTFSSDKIPEVITDPPDVDSSGTDRLGKHLVAGKTDKNAESSSLAPEDKSELSFSKESSLSLNKNTLLSPSTDEEDLFDVPPDLPEDPPKEDTDLFGRAPILSPIDKAFVSAISKQRKKIEDSLDKETKETSREKSLETESNVEKPTDPLRDNTHDPIKDPSSLFAFVTKTPSPEKGQNVLFKEDASLFTQLAKKSAEEARTASKKPNLDLFADDAGGDLFSETLAKSSKKSIRPAKASGLFDDLDNVEDDAAIDLFGSRPKAGKEKIEESITSKSSETSGRASPSRNSLFADDDDDLFSIASDKKLSSETGSRTDRTSESLSVPATSKITKDATKINDIFGDQSSGDEDLFAKSRVIGSGKGTGGSIFSSDLGDTDADDIFGTKASAKSTKADTLENRSSAKKAVTRDLKKTAETIVQDPLSMLQDD